MLFLIVSCKNEKTNSTNGHLATEKEAIVEERPYHIVETKNPNDFEIAEIDIAQFRNKVFSIGPSIEINKCELLIECDCCSSDLITFENDFILINYCMGDNEYLKGNFEIDDERLLLIFEDKFVIKHYPFDDEGEALPEEIVVEDHNELRINKIDFYKCNEQPFFVINYDSDVEFGFDTKQNPTDVINDFKTENPKVWAELQKTEIEKEVSQAKS